GYKRFICRGKYSNPALHILSLLVCIILLPYGWVYLCIIEPAIIIYEHKTGKKINSLYDLGFDLNALKELKDLSIIKKNDKNFDKNLFLERVKKAFYSIYDSRSKNELAKVKYLMSDGLYEHFSNEIEHLKENNISMVLQNSEIDRIVITAIDAVTNLETIYVAISGAVIKYNVDDSLKNKDISIYQKTLKGDPYIPQSIEEIWRFSRIKSLETNNEYSILSGNCVSCGCNLLENKAELTCPSCKIALRNNDWVLTSIAPQRILIGIGKGSKLISNDEYLNYAKINGYSSLINKDPDFSLFYLEDLILSVFWNILKAVHLLDSSPIKRFCSNEFANEFDSVGKIEGFPSYKIVELISSKIISIIIGNEDYDYIVFEIKWTGKKTLKEREKKHSSLFILRRNTKALTAKNQFFTSSHCPICNKLINTSNNICTNCNEVLNDDSKYWVLDRVIYSSQIEINKLNDMAFNHLSSNIEDIHNPRVDLSDLDYISGTDLIKMTIAIMLADGIIDKNELKAIIEIASKKQIKPEKVKDMINEIKEQPDPVNYVLSNSNIPKDMTLLLLLVNIAACDGQITDDEAQLLYRISDKMNIHRKLLYDMINSAYQSKAL
ncbi:MAG: TIM44-like domain-containing protein, partial [Candidatus Riflebacteria bacterium]|nr:TIM44-like domain-containing protein [Candidatus Riflebacteria bacterium]